MPLTQRPTSLPVAVDPQKCIADKGCTVCVESVRSTCSPSMASRARLT